MTESIQIAGRRFVPLTHGTIEHDYWLMREIRAAGLDTIVKGEAEEPQDFVQRLLAELAGSGRMFPILGGMLLPEGTAPDAWTPELGLETAAALKCVTDPADKAVINNVVVSLLLGFFVNGLASLSTSHSSSSGSGEPALMSQPTASVETSSSVSGGGWFESLRATIRRARAAYSAGRSARR